MDNAMVKRGIGAVVLAIIAALLLGYLLKDKSRERQEVVEMKLPGAPEIVIPSLTDATTNLSDSAASLVNEAKEKASNTSNAVIASTTGGLSDLSDGLTNTTKNVTDEVSSVISAADNTQSTTQVLDNESNLVKPGFSFRPPNANEEQQINTSSSLNNSPTIANTNSPEKNNTVIASVKPKVVKKFKPRIEKETKKTPKKPQTKKSVSKKKTEKAATASKVAKGSGKFAIQLLATSSQTRADKLAKTMNTEGYSTFITQTTSNNTVLYRVRVGGHKDRKAALTAQEAMKRRYQKNFFVQNSLVISQ